MSILPDIPEATVIPKLIHQTSSTKDLPAELQQNIANLKALNPDWEYRFYDDNDIHVFLKSNYNKRILEYFNRINPVYGAARADLFRYLLVYKLGGVYLDIKSTATRPLNKVLHQTDRFLLSGWQNRPGERFEGWGIPADVKGVVGGEYQQWYIIAAPGHPFLRAVILRVLKNIDRYHPVLNGTGLPGVLRLTGPIAYTLAIAPLLKQHSHRYVNSETDLGLGYSIYATLEHRAIFKAHYSVLEDSVVILGPIKAALANGTSWLKALKKRLLS
ncbi:MAG: hypothetical protein NVSMB6_10040 [Burkholderiaceae bacterium]